jgi:SpoVK/Ycf46/Vps4 family AAA+-type ATPase
MVEFFKLADTIFIDEAYNLFSDSSDKRDFGIRVIDALMTALENKRDHLNVFLAGYPDRMNELLTSNPGLQSRIAHYINLPDYSMDELKEIMRRGVEKAELKMDKDAQKHVLEGLENLREAVGPENFGNARIVRTIVEQLPTKMAERLFGAAGDALTSKDALPELTREELQRVVKADVEDLGLPDSRPVPVVEKPARLIGFTAKPV